MEQKSVIQSMAKRYPQLYVAPSPDSEEAYKRAVQAGEEPEDKSLSHFTGSQEDRLETVHTGAGDVEVLTLFLRADFETFEQIILYRAKPAEILPSVGAETIIGLRDWADLHKHMEDFRELGEEEYWEELKRYAKEKSGERPTLILLSSGPYSAVTAKQAGMGEEEWLLTSLKIRKYHELCHFMCRKSCPELAHPLWDELVADMYGLLMAVNCYDPDLAALFLGVDQAGYHGGRLIHYLGEEEKKALEDTAQRTYKAIKELSGFVEEYKGEIGLDMLIELTTHPML